jgi:hypothetical protein
VQLVEVDRLHPEPLRAGYPALLHDRRRRHDREHLGRDHDVVRAAARPQRLTEDPLATPEAVDLGGVEHGDAQLAGAADDPARLGVVVAAAVAPLPRAELPGAQPDHRVPLRRRDVVDITHAPGLHRAARRCRNRHDQDTARPLVVPDAVDRVQRADGFQVDAT